jgi:Flp pilus assembly protein TadG
MTRAREEPEPGRHPRHRSRRNGQAMLEFAMIFPLLLLLALSVLDYGYYLEHVDNIATVVRDGARYASDNTTASPWNSSCPNPVPLSAGGWSCAGLSATLSGSSVGGSAAASTLYVVSTAGFTEFSGGFTVSASASGGPTSISCGAASTSAPFEFTTCVVNTGGGTFTSALLIGESDFTEGVIQEEAEALTVPEGGLPIDNIDCCWSGQTGGTGCPGGSGTTPPAPGGSSTVVIPGAFPASLGLGSQIPVSCVTISYWSSTGGSYSPSSLSLCGWYSADAVDAGSSNGFQEIGNGGTCTAGTGELVQVTVSYAWSQSSPGPEFSILNSVFGIGLNASATYAFVVAN